MNTHRRGWARWWVGALALMVLGLASVEAEAGLLSRQSTDPAAAEAVAVNELSATAKSGCCTPCCPDPCLVYRHRGIKVKCCGCPEPRKWTLTAINPTTCCPVDVPVCLPGCCADEPCVTSRCAIVGEGVVKYTWCCGASVTVRFHKCGKVVVTYWRA